MLIHSKDSSGAQVGPQEKAEQATRCEGTDFPGAHQVVWQEVELPQEEPENHRDCPDGSRQVKEN